MRPKRVLDLFCKAGGAAMGLWLAWDCIITGVDITWQPNYCGHDFVQGDALKLPQSFIKSFDFIWASPPCQHYSLATLSQRGNGKCYVDLVAATRNKLERSGVPWVMENVPRSPLRRDLVLCGSHFGLRIVRHRVFEFFDKRSFPRRPCNHAYDIVTVCGHGTPTWVKEQRKKRGLPENLPIAEKRYEMGINWMSRDELGEAVPPVYSHYIAENCLN